MEHLEKIIRESTIDEKEKDLLLKMIEDKEKLTDNAWMIILIIIILFSSSKRKEVNNNA